MGFTLFLKDMPELKNLSEPERIELWQQHSQSVLKKGYWVVGLLLIIAVDVLFYGLADIFKISESYRILAVVLGSAFGVWLSYGLLISKVRSELRKAQNPF